MNRGALLLLATIVSSGAAACFAGERTEPGTATRNGGTASLVAARERAGGDNEGPLGFSAPISRSHLYQELAEKGIKPETLGPLNQIKDRNVLMPIMQTFARSLGVTCEWCHVKDAGSGKIDFAKPTARKAVAAYMWDAFVGKLALNDGDAVYCDSCHHQSTVFLHRNPGDKLALAKYMQTEYVDQLRRRDGQDHGCGTCHSKPFNPRFLPRISDPEGWKPPPAHQGPQP